MKRSRSETEVQARVVRQCVVYLTEQNMGETGDDEAMVLRRQLLLPQLEQVARDLDNDALVAAQAEYGSDLGCRLTTDDHGVLTDGTRWYGGHVLKSIRIRRIWTTTDGTGPYLQIIAGMGTKEKEWVGSCIQGAGFLTPQSSASASAPATQWDWAAFPPGEANLIDALSAFLDHCAALKRPTVYWTNKQLLTLFIRPR